MNRPRSEDGGGGGAFLTQKGEKFNEMKREIEELEQLLSGTNQASQSTLLLKKRKEMREVDEALELMKDEYKRRMDLCEERRLLFEQQQAKMRDQVIKFEKFIQENDAKRRRSEAKLKEERKIYEQKCIELNQTLETIRELEHGQQSVIEELGRYTPYSQYLTSFVEFHADLGFEEIADVLKRYWTLRTSNESLLIQVQQQEKEVDEVMTKLQVLQTEQENSLLVNNSLMQQRQKVLDEARVSSKVAENKTERESESQKDSIREMAEVIQGIRNLYSRCTASEKKRTILVNKDANLLESLSANLETILDRCRDLIEITSEYAKETESSSFGLSQSSTDLKTASSYSGQTAGANKSPMSKSAAALDAKSTLSK